MGGILNKPAHGCRSSSDGTDVWRVVQLLKLSKFRSPCTRSVYDRGFDADSVDVDHRGKIRGERAIRNRPQTKGILFEQLFSFYYRSLKFYQYCCPSGIYIAGCVVSGDSGGLYSLG